MARNKVNHKTKSQNKTKSNNKTKVTNNEKKLEKLRQKIRAIFQTANFTYVKSDSHTMFVGFRKI